MKKTLTGLRLSATDVASFLSCRHRTALEMGHAFGKFPKPQYDDPQLESFFQRGLEHEAAYVEVLKGEGRGRVVEIDGKAKPDDAVAATVQAMREGAGVIVQGVLGDDHWYGRPDILERIDVPSALGGWA